MLKKYFRFYSQLVKASVDIKMMYQLNFWLYCISDIVNYTVQLMLYLTIYRNVDYINGWGSYQIMFFLGTFFLIDSLAMVSFFFGVLSIPNKIRTGTLDICITKPVNTLFYVTMGNFEFTFVINLLYGIGLIVYSWLHMNIQITIVRVLGFLLLALMMYGLYFTMMLLIHSLSFWFIRIDSLKALNNELLNFASKLPGIMYQGIWKIVFMALIPYGLIATVPTTFATDVMSGRYWMLVITVCIVFWMLAIFIWKRGLRRYNSASS